MNKLGFYDENGFSIQSEEKHIIENIKRILLTRPGERVGDLWFGSNLRNYLFCEEIEIPEIIEEVKKSISIWEPRVLVENCKLTSYNRDNGILTLELILKIKKNNKVINTSLSI